MSKLNINKLRIGFLVNPWAGIGGAVALKGSDGRNIREQALERGAIPKAQQRAEISLKVLLPLIEQIDFVTAGGDMGEDLLLQNDFKFTNVYDAGSAPSESDDTLKAIVEMQKQHLDLLVFAGGDGTARDVYDVLKSTIPVVGIPAGTKIHSGVFCITPQAAGEVIAKIIKGEAVELIKASVMDINEAMFRKGKVHAREYGELLTANEPMLIQSSKSGSQIDESITQQDIAESVTDNIQPDHLYIMGSGTTIAALMNVLNLANTLLGVDVVLNQKVVGSDVSSEQLKKILNTYADIDKTLYITVIGGQGHVFGRGNQQLSPEVLKTIGKQSIQILATKVKISALNGRPLIADTGDVDFDLWLSGRWSVVVGYNETLFYPLK